VLALAEDVACVCRALGLLALVPTTVRPRTRLRPLSRTHGEAGGVRTGP
jgi:hypothetical protein